MDLAFRSHPLRWLIAQIAENQHRTLGNIFHNIVSARIAGRSPPRSLDEDADPGKRTSTIGIHYFTRDRPLLFSDFGPGLFPFR